jgi:chemotaxis protein histidine kinase CheA
VDGLLQDFLDEAADTLAQLDRDLLALARRPASPYLRADVFQALRTVHATSAFVGLARVAEAAAAGEALAARLRSGAQPVTPRAVRELGGLTHAIRDALAAAALHGGDGRFDVPAAIAGVVALTPGAGDRGLAAAVRTSGQRAVRLMSWPLREAVSRLDALAG